MKPKISMLVDMWQHPENGNIRFVRKFPNHFSDDFSQLDEWPTPSSKLGLFFVLENGDFVYLDYFRNANIDIEVLPDASGALVVIENVREGAPDYLDRFARPNNALILNADGTVRHQYTAPGDPLRTFGFRRPMMHSSKTGNRLGVFVVDKSDPGDLRQFYYIDNGETPELTESFWVSDNRFI